MDRSARSASPPTDRAGRRYARAPATTRRPIPLINPTARDAARGVAAGARLQTMPVAQPILALAHRDVLGNPRGPDRFRHILEIRVAQAPGAGTISAVGRTARELIFTPRTWRLRLPSSTPR